jgi:hypothetical protein
LPSGKRHLWCWCMTGSFGMNQLMTGQLQGWGTREVLS